MSEYGICVSCRKEYAPPSEEECSRCYTAAYGSAWEAEMMERMETGR